MALKVVDLGSNKVNQLASLLPEIIRRELRVNPKTYESITYDYKFGPSKNWDEVTAAGDLTAFYYGDPTSHPITTILGWLDKKLASTTGYLRGEGSILSFVYTKHIWLPTLVQWSICYAMTKRGDARFAKYVGPLRAWLRAGLGYMAVAAWPVKMRGMSQAQITRPPEPCVLIADAPSPANFPPVSLVACGRRGWDGEFSGGEREWLFGSMLHRASRYLCWYGLGIAASSPDEIGDALRAKNLLPGPLTDADERARIKAAVWNSVADLDWCVSELVGKWGVGNAVTILRTTGGVTCLMDEGDADPATPDATGGPTSAMVGSTLLASGVGYAMGCDSPHRGTGQNRAHEAWINLYFRKAYCQAIGGTGERPTIVMPMAPGEIVWHRRFLPGGEMVRLDGSATLSPSFPPVVNAPQVTIDDSFFERIQKCLDDFLARIRARIGA